MKETIKTILSKIDDPPTIEWKENGGDQQKELVFQEIWNTDFKKQKLEWKDVLDKKNVLTYGISTKKLNPVEGGVQIDILDSWDVLYDPLMNSMDVETARFILHQNIFRTLREILADPRYSKEGKEKLKIYLDTKQGIFQAAKNKEELEKKLERLKDMELSSDRFSIFAGGDVVFNLTEHFTTLWNEKDQKFERRVIVYADDTIELMNAKLEDLIGVTCWPFVMWMEDPETNDLYADSVADLVRVPNKVINVWFSQLIENRTLRNFQMHWYDATLKGYNPQTYEPGPGKMLPAPGNPQQTIMPVEISGLDETMNAIQFLIGIVERGSGATGIEKGTGIEKTVTLGEVQLLLGQAVERAIGMQKFYRGSWYETAKKWEKIMAANSPESMKLYKTSREGKIYPRTIYPIDWYSEVGYEPQVSSTSEVEDQKVKGIQKFNFLLQQFPDNPVLRKISQKRMLEIVDLSPDEMRQIQDAEKERMEAMANMPEAQPITPPTPPVAPTIQAPEAENQEFLMSAVREKMAELNSLTR
jgi:hypothetical protein